jgi:predicted nuclease with RNAse H fold
MIALLGIDCSANPKKTGLALGELRGGVVHILRCATGTRDEIPAAIAVSWLDEYEESLIALDTPLGWPQKLGFCLSTHRAGLPIQAEANQLFRRMTDVAIKERLGKQPLDVGANWIARTAVAALMMLDQIRRYTGRRIPLAWVPKETERWRAIEVYPAATRIGHGAPDIGGSLVGLDELIDCTAVSPELAQSEDAVDAAVCSLAAADFLSGKAAPPLDKDKALAEGWIWAPMSRQ